MTGRRTEVESPVADEDKVLGKLSKKHLELARRIKESIRNGTFDPEAFERVLAELQWIIEGKPIIKTVVFNCLHCHKTKFLRLEAATIDQWIEVECEFCGYKIELFLESLGKPYLQ